MAQLQTVFDATKVDPSQGIGQLPVASKLPVTITDSEIKGTKDNSGGYIQFTVQVGQGEHAGRKGAYRINLYNSSDAARNIAEKQLSALCHITGVFNLQDTQQLHNIPFLVDVVAQTDPKYTEIKAVYDANGNEPGRAHSQTNAHNSGGQQQTQQAQQQPAPEQQQTQNTGWGAGQTQQQSAPAWGGGQQQSNPEPQQQQPQQQPQGGGWNQGNSGGSAPWGQK